MKVGRSSRDAITVRPLHHLVLVDRDLGLEVVADAGEEVARGLEAFARAEELVVGIREVQLDVAREELGVVELDAVVNDLVDGVSRRSERTADMEERMAKERHAVAERSSFQSWTWSSRSSIASFRSSIRSR